MKESENGDYSKADAVSAYASSAVNVETYSQLFDIAMSRNEDRKKYNINIIPLFTMGWNPVPRIETSVPWIEYPKGTYVDSHTITASEFEEGAYICPTYNDDGTINDKRVSTFAKIVDFWKE